MHIQTQADFTGTGIAFALVEVGVVEVKILSIRAGVDNEAKVWFGDVNVSVGRGGFLNAGEAYDFPPIAEVSERYNLNQIYVLAQIGDTVSVIYGS